MWQEYQYSKKWADELSNKKKNCTELNTENLKDNVKKISQRKKQSQVAWKKS